MLETVDLSLKLSKAEAKTRIAELTGRLRILQQRLWKAQVPLVVVFEGWDAAGKGECISLLGEILDPRGFKVHPTFDPTVEEALRPFLWRFWTHTPGKGAIAIFDRSWYQRVLTERVDGTARKRLWKAAFGEIVEIERALTNGGTHLVKFWLHISKREQRQRFKRFEADPVECWRVRREDWRHHRDYEKHLAAAEEMIVRTDAPHARWELVPAESLRFAKVRILETLAAQMEEALEAVAALDQNRPGQSNPRPPRQSKPRAAGHPPTLLDKVDLSLAVEKKTYERELVKLQTRLRELEFEVFRRRMPVVIVYEGWDAAGKGGNIKRLVGRLDPRGYDVISISKPTPTEQAHHYLWRFWTHLPKAGHFAIFDRSWYGRVLVERVEGFCSETEWKRAYQEINEFEGQLAAFGTVVVKFWVHIDQDEQARRFEQRHETPHKRWKITGEDRRNRRKWALYEDAVVEMIERTSTPNAPWTVVEGNDKRHARLKAMRTVIERIEGALG